MVVPLAQASRKRICNQHPLLSGYTARHHLKYSLCCIVSNSNVDHIISSFLYSYQGAKHKSNYDEITGKKGGNAQYEVQVDLHESTISQYCHLLCWFWKYQYLASHVRHMYLTPVPYCSRFVRGK